ncbi:hypothetical protein GCM10009118_08010 [Wandonia haliotis]|uniref:PIN like domain-containing protein n=1 Tax=Wandonia haliotis TaxID=574963 RepID=A0ABN1MN82_9FLAO
MNYIYLDLNVFDRIEKRQRLSKEEAEPLELIYKLIENETLAAVYSNAHISDLVRAYENSPSGDTSQLNGHIEHIGALTKNLCMCLYWNEVDVKVETRDIFEFFNSSLEESENEYSSFSGLFDTISDLSGLTNTNELQELQAQIPELSEVMLPDEFEQMFEYPIFQQMYPKAFETKSMGAFMDDMLTLGQRMQENPDIYRDLKRLMNPNNINEFVKVLPPGTEINKKELKQSMKSIDIEAEMEKHTPSTKTSKNPRYDEITTLYSKIDFKGFKSDSHFINMIDDANHTFYGAHTNYFITLDKKCHYKAKEVYKKLNIGTMVFTPKEFLTYVNSLQKNAE